MTEIEIQNKINFRNIIILLLIGGVGCFNGLRDFYIYQVGIAKVIFPDPVIFQNVVVLNQTLMTNTASAINSGSLFSLGALTLFIVAAVTVIGMCAGVLGAGGGMAD